jgi:type IV fimbrial biogenesis protein FimT
MKKSSRLYRTCALGFSLMEAMVSIAILLIILTAAVPSFHSSLNANRLSVTVNDFYSALNLARAEAIRRGSQVNIAPLTDTDWTSGWTIFVDTNNDDVLDDGEEKIMVHGAVPKGLTILMTPSNTSLMFDAAGKSSIKGNWLFSLNDNLQRKIVINFFGRPRICNPVADQSSC